MRACSATWTATCARPRSASTPSAAARARSEVLFVADRWARTSVQSSGPAAWRGEPAAWAFEVAAGPGDASKPASTGPSRAALVVLNSSSRCACPRAPARR
jgi:hypothetical protein